MLTTRSAIEKFFSNKTMSILLKMVLCSLGINFLLTDYCIASVPKQNPAQFYSQASQDQFVYCLLYGLLNKEDDGYYFEIGAGHPSSANNSYFFEKELGWKGISIDIAHEFKEMWYSTRQNSLLIEDARQCNYQSVLKTFPRTIDYLSLDIDDDYDVVLRGIPFTDYIFKIITIEHDFYRFGDKYREAERNILTSLGYYLLCPDVMVFFKDEYRIFEDWWIHPSVFPTDLLCTLTSLDLKAKTHEQLINIFQNLIATAQSSNPTQGKKEL